MFEARIRRIKQGFLYTAIACVAAGGSLAIVALLTRHLSHDLSLILFSALLLGLSSSLALASSNGWVKSPPGSAAGIMLALAAAATAYIPIWSSDHSDRLWKTPVVLYLVAAAFAYTLLLASKQRAGASGRVKTSFWMAVVSIFWLCAMVIDLVARENGSHATVLGIAAVMTVTMTLITILLSRLDSIEKREPLRKPLIGRRIVLIEEGELGKVLVLDDGRRVRVAPETPLD